MRSVDGAQWWDGAAWRGLSPDRRTYWDGAHWLPTTDLGGIGPQAPVNRTSGRKWWIIGGLLALLAVIAVGAVAVTTALSLSHAFTSGTGCLPADFPRYPGSTITNVNVFSGTGGTICRTTIESGDDLATVSAFYSSHLSAGDWSARSDPATGVISFTRPGNANLRGQMNLLGHGRQTRIEVQVRS